MFFRNSTTYYAPHPHAMPSQTPNQCAPNKACLMLTLSGSNTGTSPSPPPLSSTSTLLLLSYAGTFTVVLFILLCFFSMNVNKMALLAFHMVTIPVMNTMAPLFQHFQGLCTMLVVYFTHFLLSFFNVGEGELHL